MPITVMKFGGSSLETPDRVAAVAKLVGARAETGRTAVVVSAFGGVTNDLIRAAQLAVLADPTASATIDAVAERHHKAARALVPERELEAVSRTLDQWCDDLRSLIHGVSLVRDCSPRVLDAIAGYGELFSSLMTAAALRAAGIAAEPADARRLIWTDDTFGRAIVDREKTYAQVRQHFDSHADVQVVTGFIGSADDGSTTTLGRGGSDYTATLVGAALNADVVEIWTDVDGVMSADPRLVPQAFSVPRMTYNELMELSHFGAKVVYPPSVSPARDAAVPLVIRNTLRPEFPGTWVYPSSVTQLNAAQRRSPVCGISSINSVALCQLQGAGMVGVSGIATRLFGALAREGISVILISQASSEHSICFALEPGAAARAKRRVDAEFEVERRAGAVDPLIVEEEYSVVAAVGEAMRDTPGMAGRLFDVLGRNGINVHAIAQGSSELNISLVIERTDEERALRLIHDAFFFPRIRPVQVFVAGTGRVGAALLDQLARNADRSGERLGLRLTIGGIGRSSVALTSAQGVGLENWREQIAAATEPVDTLVHMALQSPNAHRVFVDCTASAELTSSYEALLRSGAAIVTANKIALSGSLERYHALRAAARMGNGMYTETTVGAGLPVLRPIADLVATGDVVARVEGVLSGTLSFLFSRIGAGTAFSAAVKEAYDLGYTEPDPRDDLSGRDVARKLLILAREAGFEIESDAVAVEPLLPGPEWSSLSLDEFWRRLPSLDERFDTMRAAAAKADGVLCYLGSIDADGARVAVRQVDRAHPCASLSAGDNLIAVTSARYTERPLVIRGPGAGPEVTAAGVFADILRAALESR